jgi:hypothetical protein
MSASIPRVAYKCIGAFAAGVVMMLGIRGLDGSRETTVASNQTATASIAPEQTPRSAECLNATTPMSPLLIDPELLRGLSPFQRNLISKLAVDWGRDLSSVCFSPGTPVERVRAFYEKRAVASRFRLGDTDRWTTTATNGSGLSQGAATTLTWSIVPNTTTIPGDPSISTEVTSNSNLITRLNTIYGSQAVWLPIFQEVFARWSAVSGITYVYEPNDDGAVFPSSAGVLGIRGDIRIGGHLIDGNNQILAYNFFPNNGDMVIDTADNFFETLTNNSRRLKNVLYHEHGHGLGFDHTCPLNETKLMEPFISENFEGPQHDEIRGVNRGYGDRFGNNDTQGTAANLGSLVNGLTSFNNLSIDDNSDVDFYAFTIAANRKLSVTLRPVGFTYNEALDISGDCSGNAGVSTSSLAIHNLGFDVIGTDGVTVLQTRNAAAAGLNETAVEIPLTGAGTYFIRVFGDATNASQLYGLDLLIADGIPQSFVLDVTSTVANGTYGAGSVIPVTVRFNEQVFVTGKPRLELETGFSNAFVEYSAGSGTTTLTFNYTVVPGHDANDLDYMLTTSLTLNGGTIRNIGGADAILTLPVPGGAGSLGANKSIVINAPAPPVISSNPTVSPSVAGIGQTVLYSVAATDANGDALTYTWDLGDGTTATGPNVQHAYSTDGTFSASVVINDGRNGTATGGASVLVTTPRFGFGNDSDGDGFSDDYEALAGTSPMDAGSSPLSGAAVSGDLPLNLGKLSVKLNFARTLSDSLQFSGVIDVPVGFDFQGKRVTVDIGGIIRGFTLDSKGKSPRDVSGVTISKPKNGVSKYTVKFSRSDLAADLEDEGLVDDEVADTVDVPVTLIFNGKILQTTTTREYKAKAGKSGAAK